MNIKGATPKLVNIAQDITINEMIVELFGYRRDDFRDWKKYCWIDTCFPNPAIIKRNETFIYYLEKLIENPPESEEDGGPSLLDGHSLQEDGTPAPSSESEKGAREDMAETLAAELTAEELKSIIDALPCGPGLGAGAMAGMMEEIIAKKVEKKKINFTKIIRGLKKSSMSMIEKDVDTFTHDDRRFSDVIARSQVSLPGKNSIEKPSPDRILTAVFMDVSGSCIEHLPTFEKIFLAFDAERHIFDTRLFIFDTVVKEIKPGDRVRVGGGTAFGIIENKCLELQVEIGRYPDCVIVITDGDGTAVSPKAPSKWIWLLTPDHWSDRYINIKSRRFLLNQITFD